MATLVEKLLQIKSEKDSLKEVLNTTLPFTLYHEVVSSMIEDYDIQIEGLNADIAEYEGYYSPEEYNELESSIREEYEGYVSPETYENAYYSGRNDAISELNIGNPTFESNGSYFALEDNYDYYGTVTVNVEPNLTTTTITTNGTYTPGEFDGFSSVTVLVESANELALTQKELFGKAPLFLDVKANLENYLDKLNSGESNPAMYFDPSINNSGNIHALYEIIDDDPVLKRSLPCIPIPWLRGLMSESEYDSLLPESMSPDLCIITGDEDTVFAGKRGIKIHNKYLNFTKDMVESFVNGDSESSFNSGFSGLMVAYLKSYIESAANAMYEDEEEREEAKSLMISELDAMYLDTMYLQSEFLTDVRSSQWLDDLSLSESSIDRMMAQAFDSDLHYVVGKTTGESSVPIRTGVNSEYIVILKMTVLGGELPSLYLLALISGDYTYFLLDLEEATNALSSYASLYNYYKSLN